MKTFGFILIIGIMGVAFVLSQGAYWLFGWIGVVLLISIPSICVGCAIVDYYEERKLRHED